MEKQKKQVKWYNKMPHTYVILFIIVVFSAILTHILPAGEFTREAVDGVSRPVVVPNSYKEVEGTPATFFDLFTAIPKGMSASSSIIFIIMLSTGAFTVIGITGALENGIGMLLRKIKGSRIPGTMVIWIMTFLFASLGLIVGPEIQIPFTLIGVSIALGLGYDLVVGLAMVMAGGYMGWAMGPINASIIGTAHSVVGLPAFSGFGFRMILWFFTTCLVSIFISAYANKIKKDATKSIVYGVSTDGLGFEKSLDEYKLEGKHIRVLIVLLAMFLAIVIGASKFGWYLDEMSAIFILGGVVAGYVYGLKTQDIIDGFILGAKNTASIALVVGIARAIQIILENGQIMDTIIHYISEPLSSLSPGVAGIGISLITAFVHFFIPSGSGLTVTMMPLLSPLGDLLNMTQQTTVLAMQAGATIPNIILPTVGATIAMCGLARVPFEKWVKFSLKIVGGVFILSWIFIFIAVAINYGPF